ncbi:cyclodeaminase/cyclohydrolase family protein [Candidatus Falkowbacteria bacterium]|nr:cyclodeaminase/cyclohydrolase family protein [Candidatus Falkowbacteria bacterium]
MISISEQKVREFLLELASKDPAPGSGSVAALAAAMAAALVAKVCRLTVGKKEYAGVAEEIAYVRGQSEALMAGLAILAEEDKRAFLRFVADKYSPESLVETAVIPSKVANLASEVQCLAKIVAEKGNRNLFAEASLAIDLARVAKSNALLIAKMNSQ